MTPVVVLAMAVLCPSLASSAELPRNAVAVWSSGDEFVALQPADSGSTANAHPVDLNAEQIAATLSRIAFTRDGKKRELLDAASATRIAPHVAQAFRRASAQQDVLFAAVTTTKAELIGQNEVSVAARAFYADGRLQLIVGDLHASNIAPELCRSP